MTLLQTERLTIRHLTPDDASFILELLNDPAFIRNIGDRNVRSIPEAVAYVQNGPIASYEKFGHGLFMVELKDEVLPVGICGLLKRDTLDDVDIGFAFLERFRRKGYAYESAAAVMEHARRVLELRRIVAITSPDNRDSMKLLEKMGFRFERMARVTPEGDETRLFAWEP